MALLENLRALLAFLANLVVGLTLATYYCFKAILLFFVPKCLRSKDVSKDIVLITGGASGLGRLMALKFAKLGSTVVIWDLNLAGLEETRKLVEELRSKRDKVGKCHHFQVDISDRFKVYAAAERVKQEVGSVSILINNAGVVQGKRFLELDDKMIVKTFDVNTLAHFWVSCLPPFPLSLRKPPLWLSSDIISRQARNTCAPLPLPLPLPLCFCFCFCLCRSSAKSALPPSSSSSSWSLGSKQERELAQARASSWRRRRRSLCNSLQARHCSRAPTAARARRRPRRAHWRSEVAASRLRRLSSARPVASRLDSCSACSRLKRRARP